MVGEQKIDAFFKRKVIQDQQFGEKDQTSIPNFEDSVPTHPRNVQRIEREMIDIASLEHDPGKRPPIWEYPINQQDEIHRAYIKAGLSKKEESKVSFLWFFLWVTVLRHILRTLVLIVEGSKGRGENLIQVSEIVEDYRKGQKKSPGTGHRKRLQVLCLENAHSNASYTSPDIKKEILYAFSNKVKKEIRQEIGDSKFCIIVDKARDESKREQMALVLRFVDKEGFIRERFFGVVHVRDTMALTLKEAISNIRGQGYDGASNMRGEWNGLQALICNECPYAYYIHCLVHRLQLALVAASREVTPVHHFFSNLVFIINIATTSCKRNDELKEAQVVELATKIANDEIESGRGLNQIGTLKRARDTRWGSHLDSISSLLKMFNSTYVVLSKITNERVSYSQRGDADFACNQLLSFEFVFILHLMKEILQITHMLCVELQRQSKDILNAMHLISSTKRLIKNFRDSGWDAFFIKVKSFCEQHQVDIPDMNAQHVARRGRSRNQQDKINVMHYYRVDIFITTLDYQLQELNYRFNEHSVELLVLSTAFDRRDGFKLFKINDICKLAKKFYPDDFSEQELVVHLRIELQHFELDIPNHLELQNLSRTTERAFSIMKIIKTKLRNKMEDNFLSDFLTVCIEKEIAVKFSSDSIIDDFVSMKNRRVQLTF
ncbi:uncharacterized protein LOC133823788 [Humulus lupulus]|uniref:uncharacterized protein LOC133823788 n=1 Tax=Humulus lupulus TaxID=3486 RepID=UPI002B4129A1|nr:uncharacterized protein LOC133823788 [Humulus lupulus]